VNRGPRSGCFCFVAIHSTARGPALGGCRMWRYDDTRAAMRDALRLSRAMTYKSAVADLPLGGGKGVIMLPGPIDARTRKAALRDFGDTVDELRGKYVTAEDVGTSAKDMETIAERTKHVTGLSRNRGGSGDPSPWTALGVEAAIRASLERKLGSADPKGRTVVVNGLGHVGAALAKLLAKAGAKLVIADIDRSKKQLAE
jgi:leucine dehydrogenase